MRYWKTNSENNSWHFILFVLFRQVSNSFPQANISVTKYHKYICYQVSQIYLLPSITNICYQVSQISVTKYHKYICYQVSQISVTKYHKYICYQVSQIYLLPSITNISVTKCHKYICYQLSQIYLLPSITNICYQVSQIYLLPSITNISVTKYHKYICYQVSQISFSAVFYFIVQKFRRRESSVDTPSRLENGQSGVRIHLEEKYWSLLRDVQTGCAANTVSYSLDTGVLNQG
jgi:hypothetical protein